MLTAYTSLTDALTSVLGSRAEIMIKSPIAGGDINRAFCLTMRDGTRVFLKTNLKASVGFFQAEANGLSAIRQTKAIKVPQVLALGTDKDHGAFLLLEWIESGTQMPGFWEFFGHQLSSMHLAETSSFVSNGDYGLNQDNFIGAKKQVNTPCDSWIIFFRDCRLIPQFRDVGHWFGKEDRERITRLLDHLDDFLEEPENPSLLHGDLWFGNFTTSPNGEACLIDPAVYVGHAEADLAMTELFGGFPRRFYDAYREVNALRPGYEQRRDLYNLYHLLNHLNLFGGSYLPSIRRILKIYGGKR